MRIEPINRDEFVGVIGKAVASQCPDTIAQVAAERWTPQQICELIYEPDAQVRKLACLVLGLMGDRRAMPALAAGLCDLDPEVHRYAEDAAWSIWFRGGTHEAQQYFAQGLEAMDQEDPAAALHYLRKACGADPKFAEAFNQCALAHYMLEQWTEATAPCRRAVQLEPWHFGAMAGLGHCHAQLGDLEQAACCYRRALAINPRMHVVSNALARIEQCLGVTDPRSSSLDEPWSATPPPPPFA